MSNKTISMLKLRQDDLSSLNAAIRVALEIHNNTPMYKRDYSRRQQFEEIERDVLQDLNPSYELKEQAQFTVWKNGYIRLGVDTHYYSVPYKYIGKTVKVLSRRSLSKFTTGMSSLPSMCATDVNTNIQPTPNTWLPNTSY